LSGKDVILGVLKQLKRNTVAAEKLVKLVGDGLRYSSRDTRLTITNLRREFGGIDAVVVLDEVTTEYISRRPNKPNQTASTFDRIIRQNVLESFKWICQNWKTTLLCIQVQITLFQYSEADLPVYDDGFIGACTTTEGDLILASLVLK